MTTYDNHNNINKNKRYTLYINSDKSNIHYNRLDKVNVVWMIIPFANQIKSNIIQSLYLLIDIHLNKDNEYSEIINCKIIRIGYCLSKNLFRIIFSHNNKNIDKNDENMFLYERKEITHTDSLSNQYNRKN